MAVHAHESRRRREAPAGTASAARRGSDVRDALQRRDARDDRLGHGRAASRGHDGEAASGSSASPPSSRSRTSPIARRSRRRPRGRGATRSRSGGRGQFGDCWVRFAPQPRGAGYAVRRRDRRRLDPAAVHSGGRSRDSGSGGARHHRRLSARRLQGRGVRRLVSHGRLERNVVQDGRHSGVQGGRAEVQAGAARAARRGRGHHARRLHGRRARRSLSRGAATSSAPSRGGRSPARWIRAVVPQAELHLLRERRCSR